MIIGRHIKYCVPALDSSGMHAFLDYVLDPLDESKWLLRFFRNHDRYSQVVVRIKGLFVRLDPATNRFVSLAPVAIGKDKCHCIGFILLTTFEPSGLSETHRGSEVSTCFEPASDTPRPTSRDRNT